MQKRLIALVVAGLSAAPVMAQSSVTVYGVVDAYYGHGKYGDNRLSAINSGGLSGSRLGFRGKEDLGNGLKGVFTLEYALNTDQNAGVGTAGARTQFVGLEGGFGFIGLGRQYAPGYFVSRYDAAAGSGTLSAQIQLAKAAKATIDAGSGSRVNNSINYKSPDMNGFAVNAIYGFGEKNQIDDRSEGDVLGIGADYASGPIAVGFVYQQKDGGAASDQKEWMLGGAYDFGVVKLLGTYQQVKDTLSAPGSTDKLYQIGAVAPVGSGKLHFAMGKLDADAGSTHDVKSWSLSYTHSLSKRTTGYVGFLRNDNGRDASQTLLASNKDELGATVRGEDSNNFVIGVRHKF